MDGMGGHCYRIALCSVVVVCVWCALVGAFNKFGKLVRVGEVCRVVVYRCVFWACGSLCVARRRWQCELQVARGILLVVRVLCEGCMCVCSCVFK